MSSANRGRTRNKSDLYQTQYWLIESEIPRLQQLLKGIKNPVIWEPCAGEGRITRVLKHFFPDSPIYSSDIGEFDGLPNSGVDFLSAQTTPYGAPDLIISNPPFLFAQEIIQHAQKLVQELGNVVMLERLNFLGTKKRAPWLTSDVPHSSISPRRASFLPTGQCDSIEYGWFEWRSEIMSKVRPKEVGELRLLDTMSCQSCYNSQYDKVCPDCDYGYCKDCFVDHTYEACQRNLFGKTALWYCCNHPDRPMDHACRAKGCSLPFCEECWADHAKGSWRACAVQVDSGTDA